MTCQSTPDDLLPGMDRVIYKLCDEMAPCFRYFNLTPNFITGLSLLFGLISVYYICKGWIILGIFLFMISFIFDNLDGCFARRYKMTSDLGNFFDHFKDSLVVFILLYVVYTRYRHILSATTWIFLGIIAVIFYIAACTHQCCIEIHKNSKHNSFKVLETFCGDDPRRRARETLLFSPTNLMIIGFILLLGLEYMKRNQISKP